MPNPILVELTRGAIVESVHRGSYAVCDADGGVVHAAGTVDQPVFARSSMKLMQALPLIESGAADALNFTDKELALACASHSGEAGHVELAASMLHRVGLDSDDLGCGAHWPFLGEGGEQARLDMARAGKEPNALHNNCSGKHAGFLCCAKHLGQSASDYIAPTHPLQREIKSIVKSTIGEDIAEGQCSFDGCAAPTFAMSLTGLATGFARLATGNGLEPERAKAASRLMKACMAEPWYTAGTGRFCTMIMELGQGRIFAKVGAEGVYVAAIPELGLGIALKADDGAVRGCEMMLAGVLEKLLGQDTALGAEITALQRTEIKNWSGVITGEMRTTGFQ